MAPLPYLLLKNQFTKTFITTKFHYSRFFKIFESMVQIFYPSKDIKFRNWRRPTGKYALANQESVNTSIAEKCGCIMWNQQPFHRFSYGYSCLRKKSSSIKVLICGLIPRDESWSVNRVLIKDVNRIFKYLYLKHDFSFIDQSNGWILPNGDLDPSLFF